MEGTRNYYVGEERLLNHNLDDCIGGTGILLDNEKIEKQYLEYLNSLGKLKNEIEKMKIEGK